MTGDFAFIKVFETGALWAGSFVGFLGLLILADKYYVRASNGNYVWLQMVSVAILSASIAVGMIFGINPLAGIAGTFFVFYLASKTIEIPVNGLIGVGFV